MTAGAAIVYPIAVGVGVIFAALVVTSIVVGLLPPVLCGCPTGCGACAESVARVKRNRRVAKGVLAGVLVLAAWMLLASTCAGCVRTEGGTLERRR